MGVLEEILNKQDEVLRRLRMLEKNLSADPVESDTSMITSRDIINDLGVSIRTFQRMVERNELPFLIRTTKNGRYRARRCNFEKWKTDNC